jgi:hypothetical protein
MDKIEIKREMVGKGVMGLLVGLSLVSVGILGGRQLHIVWNIWPSTDGVVVSGAVQETLNVPYAKGGMPIHSYSPKVEFRYIASGKTYTTEAPSVNASDSYDKAAASLARLYATGTHHPIRYNPRDPSDIRFGTIDFGPLAFSFVLLISGVALSTVGLKALAMAYWPRGEVAPAEAKRIPSPVVSISERAGLKPSTATIYCAACGQPVKANEETCPNCLKSLRAA